MNEKNLVWAVDTGSHFSGSISTKVFLTEAEAKAYYDERESAAYRKIYQTRDIWNFREKEIERRKHLKDDRTNLKRIREVIGLSQSKLAKESGVNIRMIQHYEQGVKDLNKAQAITVYRLAQALNCTVEDLLEK